MRETENDKNHRYQYLDKDTFSFQWRRHKNVVSLVGRYQVPISNANIVSLARTGVVTQLPRNKRRLSENLVLMGEWRIKI